MFGGQHLGGRVVRLVREWQPTKRYEREAEYVDDLRQFLTTELNGRRVGFGGHVGTGGEYAVDRTNDWLDVEDTVGIVVTRNVGDDDRELLEERLTAAGASFRNVVVCACGVEEEVVWRDLSQQFGGRSGAVTFGADGPSYAFVRKRLSEFGSDGLPQSGLFGSDPSKLFDR